MIMAECLVSYLCCLFGTCIIIPHQSQKESHSCVSIPKDPKFGNTLAFPGASSSTVFHDVRSMVLRMMGKLPEYDRNKGFATQDHLWELLPEHLYISSSSPKPAHSTFMIACYNATVWLLSTLREHMCTLKPEWDRRRCRTTRICIRIIG